MKRSLLGVLACLVLPPLVLLWPALVGEQVFTPFDHRVFPPESLVLPTSELDALRAHANFDITEKTLLCEQEIRLAQDELAAGRLPTWNPFVRVGAPLLANGLAGLLHPLHALHLLMDPARAFVWTAWIGLCLAGALMFGFLRGEGLAVGPALLGAVAFAWSGTLSARLHLFMHYDTLLWMPGLLWAIAALTRGGGVGAMVALAIATACTWTAGFPPAALTVSLTAGAWWLGCIVVRVRRDRQGARRVALWGGAGFLLGLALAGVHLLPLLAYYPESQRAMDPGAAWRSAHAVDPAEWLGLLLDAPFATPALNRPGGVPYDKAPLLWVMLARAGAPDAAPALRFTEHKLYLGALPFLLACAAVGRGAARTGLAALVGALALLIVAAGGPATEIVVSLVPPARTLQPMEFLAPVPALFAIAAACGWQRLASAPPRVRGATVAAAALAMLALVGVVALGCTGEDTLLHGLVAALRARWGARFVAAGEASVRAWFAPVVGPAAELLQANLVRALLAFAAAAAVLALARSRPRAAVALAIVVVLVDLVSGAWPLDRCQSPPPAAESAVHRFLRDRRDAHAASDGGITVARVASCAADGTSVPELPDAIAPDLLVPQRIRDLHAYACVDGRSGDLVKALYRDQLPALLMREEWFQAFPDDARLAGPLLDLFGVRYLLCHVPPGREPPRHAGRPAMPPLCGPGGGLHVFERPSALGRAFVVPAVDIVPTDTDAVAAMIAPGFRPKDVAVATRVDWQRLGLADDWHGATEPARVTFVRDTPTHVVIEVESGGGLLVITDAALSGWRARVLDGDAAADVPVARVDHAFRAVVVPRGTVRVEWTYDAPGLLAGAAATVLAIVVCMALSLRCWKRRKTPPA